MRSSNSGYKGNNRPVTMPKKRSEQNNSPRSHWLNLGGVYIEPNRYEPKESPRLADNIPTSPQYFIQQHQQHQQHLQQPPVYPQFAPVDRLQYRLPAGAVNVPNAFAHSGVGFGAQQLHQPTAAYVANGGASANPNDGVKSKPQTYSGLQQRLQHLHQQQALHTSVPQQQQQPAASAASAAPAAPPQLPSYSDQMQTAFASYQQQQQQQQHLLQQLYEQYPQIPFSQVQESNNAVIGSSMYDSQNVGLQQGQFQRQPYYSTQQHAGFLQRQQDSILRDQHKVLNQHYDPSEPVKGMQMYGMAVPESSVANPTSYSPASEVSHVNFSSGNVKYTF